MTSVTDICNRALQAIGTRTTVTDAELANNSTNEAIQFNLTYEHYRDDLMRLAPWNCVLKTANLTYITSVPGTPENSSPATSLWTPGQPSPPWGYEYQYPVDCLRAVYIIPANQTGFASGIPITTAVTGGAAAFWTGPPVTFRVNTDRFLPVTAVQIVSPGINYQVGDLITVALQPTANGTTNRIGTFLAGAPQGAAVIIRVDQIAGGIVAASPVNVIAGSSLPIGGSYFYRNTATAQQASTTGLGTGAEFSLVFSDNPVDQRVILTNQEFATLVYCRQIPDPNVWDTLFQSALINLCAGGLYMALRGSATEANKFVDKVNFAIEQARSIDGNEGFIVNDITPDWIRVRGWAAGEGLVTGPYSNFEWGGGWPSFA